MVVVVLTLGQRLRWGYRRRRRSRTYRRHLRGVWRGRATPNILSCRGVRIMLLDRREGLSRDEFFFFLHIYIFNSPMAICDEAQIPI